MDGNAYDRLKQAYEAFAAGLASADRPIIERDERQRTEYGLRHGLVEASTDRLS